MQALRSDTASLNAEINTLARSLGTLPSQVRATADAFNNLATSEQKVAAATKLEAEYGTQIIPKLQSIAEHTRIVREEQEKLGASMESAGNKTGLSAIGMVTQINRIRRSFDELLRGDPGIAIVNIMRSMATEFTKAGAAATVGLGAAIAVLAAIAVAALAAAKVIEGMVSTAEEIGTRSRDDFDELQKSLQRVNFQLTLADHALGQAVTQAIKDVHSAATALFVEILRESGPALIVFLNLITKMLEGMIPIAKQLGALIAANFIQLGALIQALVTWVLTHDVVLTYKAWATAIDSAREAADKLGKSLASQTGEFDPVKQKKQKEDLTEAQLKENEAQRAYNLELENSRDKLADIDRALKANAITAADAEAKRLAIQANLRNAQEDLFEAQEARIDADVKGERRRTDAFEELANERTLAEKKSEEDQKAIHDKGFADTRKQWEDYLKFIDQTLARARAIGDAVIKSTIRAGGEIPGRPDTSKAFPGLPDEKTTKAQLDAIHDQFNTFFAQLKIGFEESGTVFSSYFEFAIGILENFAKAVEQSFAAFIETGKFGAAAFKKMVAQIIAALAVESAIKAIFEFAEAFAASARGDVAGFLLHTAAANTYLKTAIVAGAAGLAIGAAGGLGGSSTAAGAVTTNTTPPSTTINTGGGRGLAITPGQAFGALNDSVNNLNNKISSMSPGDVVTVAANTQPNAFATGVTNATKTNSSFSRTLGLTLLPST
jgi:hypothetical protein